MNDDTRPGRISPAAAMAGRYTGVPQADADATVPPDDAAVLDAALADTPPEVTIQEPAPTEAIPTGPPPLRDAVLAGRFFTAAHRDDAYRVAGLPGLDDATALAHWFGPAALRFARQKGGLRRALDRDIAALDTMIGAQLDAILHHARLRRFEGGWRGLLWLAEGLDPGNKRLRLRVLNASWADICRDLERAPEFDQSHLFRKIYEDEFGMPGGEPFGLMVVDHEVRHRPAAGAPTDDVTALKLLAGVAAAAFMPTILGASPELLGLDDFAELATVSDPAAPLRGPDYARWRGLFGQEDIRFLALTLPRMLARPPWLDDPARADRFRYSEYAPGAASRVWSSAAYGFAATVVRAFATHAWPADVRGVDTDRQAGGLVDHMPVEPFRTDTGLVWRRPSLDVVLTDRQERILVDGGMMPLSSIPFTDEAAFGAVRSMQMPQQYTGGNAQAANANARLSAQINTLLCISRFAHYLKVMGRDMVGAFRTEDEVERQLQSWLGRYVNNSMSAGPETRAKYPLVAGRVQVRERPGRPGVFGCTIQLQPHFQLDDVSATFRLVTDIAAPGALR